MITLQKLKLFVVVYERRSLNQAAQELYMAQSAISQNIQSLEAALGVRLFERSPRGVQPTAAGDTLYTYARQILQLLAKAEREVLSLGERQSLSVEATPGVSVYLLPNWLQQFQRTQSNLSVSLQTALTIDVVHDVLNGRCELGFLEGELEELDQPALGRMRVQDIDYFVTVNAKHPLAAREQISVQELSDLPLINRQPTSRTRRWLESQLQVYGVKARSLAELDSPGAIKYALLSEGQLGYAILSRYAVEREVQRGELTLIPLIETELKRPLLVVWNRGMTFTPIQRAFIALLAQDAPQLQILL
ncbi:MAG: LysR family transcriptional regulator [Chloroflexi bacterium]|nr:LysR family transcriptional regulator [Chloroflexota bacterium]